MKSNQSQLVTRVPARIVKRKIWAARVLKHFGGQRWSASRKYVKKRYTYLIVNEGGKGKKIEEVGEESPDICVSVFAKTFVVEAIHLRYLSRLMVSAKDGYSVAIA